MKDKVIDAVYQAVGEASVCWDNVGGAGEFDAEKATQVGDSLLEMISNEVEAPLDFILEPLENIPPDQLYKVAAGLQQQGGEYQACGKVLWRTIEHLFGGEGQPPPKKPLGLEEAYGSMTFPLGRAG